MAMPRSFQNAWLAQLSCLCFDDKIGYMQCDCDNYIYRIMGQDNPMVSMKFIDYY